MSVPSLARKETRLIYREGPSPWPWIQEMGKKPHILVFPCPTQGHINGMLNFAACLVAAHELLEVTFVHSARNYARLQSSSSRSHPRIHLVALPDGLPPEAEAPMPWPLPIALYFESLHAMVRELGPLLTHLHQAGTPVTCLVTDTLLPGTQLVADTFGIARVDFWTSSAACFYICLHLPELISHGFLPLPDCPDIESHLEETMVDCIAGMPEFPLAEITKEIQAADVSHPWIQFMLRSFSQVRSANRIFVHSFQEIEGSIFDAAHVELGLPMYPVGPLVEVGSSNRASLLVEDDECLGWLDKQGAASVILVSFGSCASLSAEEIEELGAGLEASEQPFLLVLRPGSYVGCLRDILGQGYAQGQGFVTGWAPQRTVLAHPAVGGFLSHCGWNSTLESLWMGVPLIGCPRGSEQRANVRYIAKYWKVGIALERQKGGGFSRHTIESAVRRLMQSQEGIEARKTAMELRDKARKAVSEGGLSKHYIDQFVKDMLDLH